MNAPSPGAPIDVLLIEDSRRFWLEIVRLP
jgi:hypothetical protein